MEAGGEKPKFLHLTCLRIGAEALMSLMLPFEGEGRLVDALPAGLEELVIRGYNRANATEESKSQIEEIRERMAEKLPKLKILKGIDELIPNGEDMRRPPLGAEDNYEGMKGLLDDDNSD